MSTRTLFSVGLCLLFSGCDFSPTSSFEGFDGHGATLTGSFQSSSVAAAGSMKSQRALAASAEADALTVVVYDGDGNELGSVDVVGGEFSLRGLPERFVLVFKDESGNALGDPMTFEGVSPNQEVDIVVEIVSGEVVLIEEKRRGIGHQGSSGIEIEGLASNVVHESTNAMNGSLDVNGYHVLSRAAETSIRKGNRSLTLADLDDGDRVHVRGVFEDGDVLAHEIKLQEEEEHEDGPPAACNYRDPAKPNHILICHKGRTLSVAPDAWGGHAGHGDTCGPCGR
jgi:hypothetical protein